MTVVFEAEYDLLELQARSFARFVSPGTFARVIVLENTRRPLSARRRRKLKAAYGIHASEVEFLHGPELVAPPATSGWRSQQILKLEAARIIDTVYYLTLDAKNHFVQAAEPELFLNSDGRPRGNFHHYTDHPLRPSLEQVLDYFALQKEPRIDRFVATTTPFVLQSEKARDLIGDIESRTGLPFAQAFVEGGFTEFFLYGAWLDSQGVDLETMYDSSGIRNETVWPRGRSRNSVVAAIERAKSRNSAVFSVHRGALARMTPPATRVIAEFWVERDLFSSRRTALAFVARYRVRRFIVTAGKRVRRR